MIFTKIFWNNAQNYADQATVHGVSYVFGNNLSLTDRLLWVFIVLTSFILTIWMVNASYNDWKEHPVITTLKTTTKPVNEVDFPAITVCAAGKTMELVKKAIYNKFLLWKKSQGLDEEEDAEDLKKFLKDIFQITKDDTRLMEILDTMINPDAAATKAIINNERACAKSDERRKREAISKCMN